LVDLTSCALPKGLKAGPPGKRKDVDFQANRNRKKADEVLMLVIVRFLNGSANGGATPKGSQAEKIHIELWLLSCFRYSNTPREKAATLGWA
jgi:hypothetical protein